LVDLTGHGPQRIYNIACKGRVALGYDADFVLVDMKARRRITVAAMASKTGWTPFDGMEITGWPIATILRGRVAVKDGEIIGPPSGEPVRFLETLGAH